MKTRFCWLQSFLLFCGLCLSIPAEDRPTCAVLNFEAGAGLSEEEARFIHARFSALLPKFDQYDVVAESRIQDLLKVAQFNRSDFTSTMDYALEIGKVLQIRYMIIGTVGRIGDLYSLNTSVVDIETGKIIDTAITDHKGTITDFSTRVPEQNIQELLYGAAAGTRTASTDAPAIDSGTAGNTTPVRASTSVKDRRAALQQAQALYEAGLYKESMDAVKQLMKESGPSVEAHILLGEAYAKQKGWYNLAVRELEKAIAMDSTSVEARMALARVHLEVGRRADRAAPLLKQVQILQPDQPDLDRLMRAANLSP